MKYFTKKTLQFFEHLEWNNSKEWFDENRQWYHDEVKDPFDVFVRDVIKEMQKDDPLIAIEPKHAKFRINRDIRFSKNKLPYKTHVWAVISRGWRKDMLNPWLYVHIGNDGLNFGSGIYQPDKEHLHVLRQAIAKQPKNVMNIIQDPKTTKIFGELQWQKNKRIPKEFQEKAEAYPILYNKQFYFYTKYPNKKALWEDLLEFSMKHRFAAKPWAKFVQKALKEFTIPQK